MFDKTLYSQIYDSLPEEAKRAMSDLWETGINDTGVRVRYGNVEATVGKIVWALRKKEVLSSMYGSISGESGIQKEGD